MAQWLVEAARRARLDPVTRPTSRPIAAAPRKAFTPTARRSALVSIAGLAFLQYYYFYVMVEIGKLPTLIVFVPAPLS